MKRILATVAVVLALIFSTISLLVDGVLLYSLLQTREAGLETIAVTRSFLSNLSERTIEATVPLHHAVPVEATVPVRQNLVVPIHTTLPISTDVSVLIDFPLVGERSISFPVQAEVPVDLEVAIPISQTVQVETVVQVDTEVPIQVEMSQLGLDDLLAQVDEILAAMERELRNPLAP